MSEDDSDLPQHASASIRGKSNRSVKNPNRTMQQPAKHPEALEKKLEEQCKAIEGRPSKAELKELKLIEWFCRRGWTLSWICEEINRLREVNGEEGMSYESFTKLKDRFPEFFGPMRHWMEDADKQVKAALFESSIGAEVWEERPVVVQESFGDTVQSRVEIHKVRKKTPPNAKSIQFWLTNRLGNEWKHKVEGGLEAFKALTDEQLVAMVRQELSKLESKETPKDEE